MSTVLVVFCYRSATLFSAITDLSVGVERPRGCPFVSLFQVFTAAKGEDWNEGKGVLETQLLAMHEGDRVNRREQSSTNSTLLE